MKVKDAGGPARTICTSAVTDVPSPPGSFSASSVSAGLAANQSQSSSAYSAKLIDTESGVHLWAEQFDSENRDLSALQHNVAEEIRILMPGFSIGEWVRLRLYKKHEHRQALIDGLRLAGLD